MAQPFRKQNRSVRLFALLVRFLPADFRMRHGSQMVQTFQDCWRDLVSRGGLLDLARFWGNTFADLLLTALILHTERFTMSAGRAPAHLTFLTSPWVLFHRLSATHRWLARFGPYPKAFRKPLQFAWFEAKAYSSAQIQPEHLLLGLLRATKSVRQHVPPSAIQSAIAIIDLHTGHGRALGAAPAPSDPSIDALSQQIIARALERAALRRQRLSGLHLLLALCEERSSVVSECLETLGLDQPWLESQLQAA
jgi:hypothetical protein